MSLPDGAEYWFKNPRAYSPNNFRHAKGVDCGHNHNSETEYFNDVECRACRKIIEENRPDNLLDGEAPKYYYFSKTYAKKMRKADREQKEFNDKYGICACGSNLVIRTNSKDKKQFLGCSQYPKCKHTETLIKK